VPEAHVNGVRLYYEEHGEGAPIACIHGLGSTALMWADALEELARRGRVITNDRRGGSHGCQQDERAAFGEKEVRALRNALSFGLSTVSREPESTCDAGRPLENP